MEVGETETGKKREIERSFATRLEDGQRGHEPSHPGSQAGKGRGINSP